MKTAGTWAHTVRDYIFVPERRYIQLNINQTAEALRGYAHTLAVFENGWCVGWISKEHADKFKRCPIVKMWSAN